MPSIALPIPSPKDSACDTRDLSHGRQLRTFAVSAIATGARGLSRPPWRSVLDESRRRCMDDPERRRRCGRGSARRGASRISRGDRRRTTRPVHSTRLREAKGGEDRSRVGVGRRRRSEQRRQQRDSNGVAARVGKISHLSRSRSLCLVRSRYRSRQNDRGSSATDQSSRDGARGEPVKQRNGGIAER